LQTLEEKLPAALGRRDSGSDSGFDSASLTDSNRDAQSVPSSDINSLLMAEIGKQLIAKKFFSDEGVRKVVPSWGIDKYNEAYGYLEKKCFAPENEFWLGGVDISEQCYRDITRALSNTCSVQKVNEEAGFVSSVDGPDIYNPRLNRKEKKSTPQVKKTLQALHQLARERNIKFSGETDEARIEALAKRDVKALTNFISQMSIGNIMSLTWPTGKGEFLFKVSDQLGWFGGSPIYDHTTIFLLPNGAYAIDKSILNKPLVYHANVNASFGDEIFIDALGNGLSGRHDLGAPPLDVQSFVSYNWTDAVLPDSQGNDHIVTPLIPPDIQYKVAFEKAENSVFENNAFFRPANNSSATARFSLTGVLQGWGTALARAFRSVARRVGFGRFKSAQA
jgi:hypothetical protein